MIDPPDGGKSLRMFTHFDIIEECDRRTDRQTVTCNQGHDIIQRQITPKRYKIELKLQWKTDSKSYVIYRMTPF